MVVADLPEEALLIQNSQDRLAVLESLGLEELLDEYPTLFALVGDAEYRKGLGHSALRALPGRTRGGGL